MGRRPKHTSEKKKLKKEKKRGKDRKEGLQGMRAELVGKVEGLL